MDIIVTLRKKENIDRIKNAGGKGIIIGSLFSLNFNYSLEELKEITEISKSKGLDCYIEINALINEKSLSLLNSYIVLIKELNVKGIYYSDFAVVEAARDNGLKVELIYDPITLVSNSIDVACLVNQGMGAVISRDLNLEETKNILLTNQNNIDIQIFGHLRLSYSKRKFLSNYEREIKENLNIDNNKKLRIEEETRQYSFPIIEDNFGTRIYTDYIYLLPVELAKYKQIIKRGIVDDIFVDDISMVITFIQEVKRINEENIKFIQEQFFHKYQSFNFSNGFMFEKMNIRKNENEED